MCIVNGANTYAYFRSFQACARGGLSYCPPLAAGENLFNPKIFFELMYMCTEKKIKICLNSYFTPSSIHFSLFCTNFCVFASFCNQGQQIKNDPKTHANKCALCNRILIELSPDQQAGDVERRSLRRLSRP